MDDFISIVCANHLRILDITGTALGIAYIVLEYRASIWLWPVSIVMPLVDMFLYLDAGLYADFGMAVYYAFAAVYGFVVWKFGWKQRDKSDDEMPITRFPHGKILPTVVAFALAWTGIYLILSRLTNSNVPVTDSFVNALSIIGLWALAHKHVEQWLIWIVVDAVCCALYAYKGIPFKAGLYGLYAIIAVFGYVKWKKLAVP